MLTLSKPKWRSLKSKRRKSKEKLKEVQQIKEEVKEEVKLSIYDHVLKWQEDVQQIKEEVKEFLRMCFPNVYSRFRTGREAVKKTEKVIELTVSGKEFVDGEISYRPRLVYADLHITTSFDSDYVSFESREDAYKKILEALNNKDAGFVVGIYGIAGAGKTRMMEQAWKQAKKDGIFDDVARADVSSEKLDVGKLQQQLASCLKLDLSSEENEEMRAALLAKRLTQKGNEKGNKILVLFDDVWEELPLNKIGVPFGDGRSKGCKILLTSRKRDVLCSKNNCKDPIEIKVLKEEEGWDLFEKNVDSATINSLNDESLAKKVCDECACLPLVIAAVGKALKGKPHDSWKDALGQLQNSKLQNIDGIDTEVYAGLVLSFNHLQRDAKSCLFLCSVFPEDAAISIEELVRLVKGNRLIEDLDTLEKARDRVRSMVIALKDSSLLLLYDDTKVKLHDIIRDVAKSVAAKDPAYAFLEKSCGTEWPDVDYKDRKLISLSFDNINYFPDLGCPELHTLELNLETRWEDQQFPDMFFRGFSNLRVLVLNVWSNSHLSSSLQSLTNLRMLSLYNADLNMSLIKELKSLEMLIILHNNIEELSLELRELKRLRLLDISRNDCRDMIMPRHLLSSLSNLEELYIPRGFSPRGEEEEEGGDPNPIHHEPSKLTNLTTLHIHLPDAMFLPNEKICQKLLRYVIDISPYKPYVKFYSKDEKRALRLSNVAMQGRSSSSLEILLERVEYMELARVNGFQTYFNHGKAFANLERLSIWKCDDLEHLGRLPQNYQQLPHHQPMILSFPKLTELQIEFSSGFKYLFCPSSATRLVQLQKLWINDCTMMEEIIRPREQEDEGEEEEIIKFPNLREMNLWNLPRLKSFYCKKINMRSATPNQNTSTFPVHYLFNDMDCTFPNLAKLYIYKCDDLDHLERLPRNYQQLPHHQPMIMSFSKLTELEIEKCGFKYLFCPSSARRLVQLRMLLISDCSKMEGIIRPREQEDEEEEEIIEFPNLREMDLSYLPRLKSFYCKKINMRSATPNQNTSTFPVHSLFNGMDCTFPNLAKLSIDECDDLDHLERLPQNYQQLPHHQPMIMSFSKLTELYIGGCRFKYLFCPSSARLFVQLQKLSILQCTMMEGIIRPREQEDEEEKEKIVEFPNLREMNLRNLPRLKSFYCKKINMRSATPDQNTSTFPVHSLFNGMVSFPVLNELSISSIENVIQIWEPQCHTQNVIPFAMLQRLQNMETLQVRDCRSLKCIVNGATTATTEDQEGSDSEIVFPVLKTLELWAVPKLDNFWCTRSMGTNIDQHQPSLLQKVSFPRLENLEIDVKLNWEQISLGDSTYQLRSLMIHKLHLVLFPPSWLERLQNLEKLRVGGISSDVSKLADLMGCFRGLKELFVEDCNFSNLFTCSLAKTNFQRLEKLRVQSCQKMEEIVTDENEGNKKMVAIGSNAHLFPRLKTIDLWDLPVLKSFCGSARYAFNMPSLEEVELRNCPLMINFTCRQLTTAPKFKIIDDDRNVIECTDLNKYLQTLLGPEGELESANNSDGNQDNTEDDVEN